MFSAFKQQTATGKKLNMFLAAGDNAVPQITVSLNSVPVNITGYTIKMTIKMGSASVVLSTGNGGITITNAAAGQFTINMTTTITSAWPSGTYQYDIWLESQNSPPIENQYASGQITISQSITVVP